MFEGGRGGIEEVVVVTGYGKGTEEVGLKKICSVIGVRTIIPHLNRPRIFGTQDPSNLKMFTTSKQNGEQSRSLMTATYI